MPRHPDHPDALPQSDIDILRSMLARKLELVDGPVNRERRRAWLKMDASDPTARPIILAEVSGCMSSAFPDGIPLTTTHPIAQRIEGEFFMELWNYEVLQDDHVLEPFSINVPWSMTCTDYGVAKVDHYADTADGALGARKWDAPIKDLDTDLDQLHFREPSVDKPRTLEIVGFIDELFGDMAPATLHGSCGWSQGLTWSAIDLIGLENLMLFMYDNPEGLHRLMSFLRDDHLNYTQWMESEGLLTLNNTNQYCGSGSLGYTNTLPADDFDGEHVRLKDQWLLSESQETVGVGPELFEEFIFPYQVAVAEQFGQCYYGCCEPVHTRWHVLKKLKNLKRMSISPWCDQEFMAREMGSDYVFSRKPNPAMISTNVFDEAVIREDLATTLNITKDGGCPVEIVMKDVHTLGPDSDRLERWVAIAREEVEKVYGV